MAKPSYVDLIETCSLSGVLADPELTVRAQCEPALFACIS
jgi:hypothetical protein